MKYCGKCQVEVRGALKRCPLCQWPLEGSSQRPALYYPRVTTVYKQYQTFFRYLMLGTVIVAVVCAAINLILPASGKWALYVAVGLVCFWISMILAIKKRKSISQNITYQALIMSALSMLWDLITGWNRWSLDYAIPIIFTVTVASMLIVSRIMKTPAGEYLLCMTVTIVYGFIPIIFYAAGLLQETVPSVICISFSVIALAIIILFKGEEIKQEIARRFHL